MIVALLRFVVLSCAGLLLGLTLTHVLQAPGSRELGGGEWLAVQHTFYGGFAVVGGICEIAGVIATAILGVCRLRAGRVGEAIVSFVASAALIGTLLAFVFGNAPVNAMVAGATAATLPPDWSAYRNSWESAHAISAALSAVAFLAQSVWLVTSVRRAETTERALP